MWVKHIDFESKHICDFDGKSFVLLRRYEPSTNDEILQLVCIGVGEEITKDKGANVCLMDRARASWAHYTDGKRVKMVVPPILLGHSKYDVVKGKIKDDDGGFREVSEFIDYTYNVWLMNMHNDITSFSSYHYKNLELYYRDCIADCIIPAVKNDVLDYITRITMKYVNDMIEEYNEKKAKERAKREFVKGLQKEFFGVS